MAPARRRWSLKQTEGDPCCLWFELPVWLRSCHTGRLWLRMWLWLGPYRATPTPYHPSTPHPEPNRPASPPAALEPAHALPYKPLIQQPRRWYGLDFNAEGSPESYHFFFLSIPQSTHQPHAQPQSSSSNRHMATPVDARCRVRGRHVPGQPSHSAHM